MSNHFIAINRGLSGTKISDLTFGTASSAGSDFELRIADVDGQGKVVTDKDVILALIAFKMAILSGSMWTKFPPL
jgi:hypothetical protein